MPTLWKPQLAAKPEPETLDEAIEGLRYPLLGSPKLDGVRCTVQNGSLYTRALKLVANKEMQAMWGKPQFNGLDGEIIVGDPVAEDCFNRTSSVVRNANKSAADAIFYVFDKFGPETFSERSEKAKQTLYEAKIGLRMVHVLHVVLKTAKALRVYEKNNLDNGHEGIMLRDPNGLFKQGRSTMKEGGLIAIKRFVDAEAVILDTYEQEENNNEQTLNELGKLKRSTHKAGKVGKGTLGGFTVVPYPMCRCHGLILPGKLREAKPCAHTFNIGTGVGLTEAWRGRLWLRRETLPGKIVKFRYQKVGTMEKPRIPIFLGFRDESDIS